MKKLKGSSTRWLAAFGGSVLLGTSGVVVAETTPTNASPSNSTSAKKTTATTEKASTKPKTSRARGTANARILHAIKGGPAVDVYLNDKKVLTSAEYKSVSDYLELPSGKHALKITASGQNNALLSSDITLTKGKFFTLAAYGTPQKPLLLRVNETLGKVTQGKARVFVVHLAQAPAVDVTTPSTRSKAGYASFLKGVLPGKSRAKSASVGDVKLQARAEGKIAQEADAKIEAGKRYAVFAVGDAGALDLIVKPAATGYAELLVEPKAAKPKATKTKSPTPKPSPVSSPMSSPTLSAPTPTS